MMTTQFKGILRKVKVTLDKLYHFREDEGGVEIRQEIELKGRRTEELKN